MAGLSKSHVLGVSNITFSGSGFFKRNLHHHELPSPAQVRERAAHGDRIADRHNSPAIFAELGLLVKFGRYVTAAEGQCLWVVGNSRCSKTRGGPVPVPEVYGWRTDDAETFVYQELIEGDTLLDRWAGLSHNDKLSITKHLRDMIQSWRNELRSDPADPYVGQVGRQPIGDKILFKRHTYFTGPFPSVRAFYDFWDDSQLWRTVRPEKSSDPDPARKFLTDGQPVMFTHGDLHRSNILLSRGPSNAAPKIIAIIDWNDAGWYPFEWEACKASWTVTSHDNWGAEYLPRAIYPVPKSYMNAWGHFCDTNLGVSQGP